MFWVGGTGNWSDPAHWSASSGGPGGSVIPTTADDVVFNTASSAGSYVVTINTGADRVCHALTFGPPASGTLTLAGTGKLVASGTVTKYAAMLATFTGEFMMNPTGSAAAHLINAGVPWLGSFITAGSGAAPVELDDALVCQLFRVQGGIFDSHSQDITMNGLRFDNFAAAPLFLGSHIILNIISGVIPFVQVGAAPNADFGAAGLFEVRGNLDVPRYLNDTSNHLILGNVLIKTTGAALTFRGVSEFSSLQFDLAAGPCTFLWEGGGTTQTFSSFTRVAGTNVLTMGAESGFQNLNCSQPTRPSLDYLNLSNLHASGGAWYAGPHSTDGGGNTGWSFTGPPQLTTAVAASRSWVQGLMPAPAFYLYWVGGSGDWNDIAHWSPTSGGVGGAPARVPTLVDAVIFDANSSPGPYTFTMNVAGNKLCSSLTIGPPASGDVTWAGTVQVNVNGSLTLYPGLIKTHTGTIAIAPFIAHTALITAAGVPIANSLILAPQLNNASNPPIGWVKLAGPVICTNPGGTAQLRFNSGTFDSQGFDITTNQLVWLTAGVKGVFFRNSYVKLIFTGTAGAWNQTQPCPNDWGTSLLEIAGDLTTAKNIGKAGLNEAFYDVKVSATGAPITFLGNNTYNSLLADLTGGPRAINFASGTTHTFANLARVAGTNLLTLASSVVGVVHTLIKTGAAVVMDYLNLTDSSAVNPPDFFAGYNSINGGNVAGWQFISALPTTAVHSTWVTPVVMPGVKTFTTVVSMSWVTLKVGLLPGMVFPVFSTWDTLLVTRSVGPVTKAASPAVAAWVTPLAVTDQYWTTIPVFADLDPVIPVSMDPP